MDESRRNFAGYSSNIYFAIFCGSDVGLFFFFSVRNIIENTKPNGNRKSAWKWCLLTTQSLNVQRFDAKGVWHSHFVLSVCRRWSLWLDLINGEFKMCSFRQEYYIIHWTTCKWTECYASIAIHRLWPSWNYLCTVSIWNWPKTVNNNEREVLNWNWFATSPIYTNTNVHSYSHRSQSRLISEKINEMNKIQVGIVVRMLECIRLTCAPSSVNIASCVDCVAGKIGVAVGAIQQRNRKIHQNAVKLPLICAIIVKRTTDAYISNAHHGSRPWVICGKRETIGRRRRRRRRT